MKPTYIYTARFMTQMLCAICICVIMIISTICGIHSHVLVPITYKFLGFVFSLGVFCLTFFSLVEFCTFFSSDSPTRLSIYDHRVWISLCTCQHRPEIDECRKNRFSHDHFSLIPKLPQLERQSKLLFSCCAPIYSRGFDFGTTSVCICALFYHSAVLWKSTHQKTSARIDYMSFGFITDAY